MGQEAQSEVVRPRLMILQRYRERGKKKRWDDIKEWTGLEFANSQRAVENRKKWRELVAKL